MATPAPATSAPAIASVSADVTSAICDPWLTAEAVARVSGRPPQAAIGHVNPSLDEWPGSVACQWDYADGSSITFSAGYTSDKPTLLGNLVTGLGDKAEVEEPDQALGTPRHVVWIQGKNPTVIMDIGSGKLSEDELVSLAHAVTIPSL